MENKIQVRTHQPVYSLYSSYSLFIACLWGEYKPTYTTGGVTTLYESFIPRLVHPVVKQVKWFLQAAVGP